MDEQNYFILLLYFSQSRYTTNLSEMKLDQVEKVGHGIFIPLYGERA